MSDSIKCPSKILSGTRRRGLSSLRTYLQLQVDNWVRSFFQDSGLLSSNPAKVYRPIEFSDSKSDWAQVLDMELQAIATDEVEKQNSRDPTQTSPVQTYYINFIKKTKGRLKSIAIPVCSDGVEFRDDVFFEKARKELGLNGWCHSHLPYYVLRVFYQITYVQYTEYEYILHESMQYEKDIIIDRRNVIPETEHSHKPDLPRWRCSKNVLSAEECLRFLLNRRPLPCEPFWVQRMPHVMDSQYRLRDPTGFGILVEWLPPMRIAWWIFFSVMIVCAVVDIVWLARGHSFFEVVGATAGFGVMLCVPWRSLRSHREIFSSPV